MHGQNQAGGRTFMGNRTPQQPQSQFVSNNNGSDPVTPGQQFQGNDPRQFIQNQQPRQNSFGMLLSTAKSLTQGRNAGSGQSIYANIEQGRHTDWSDITGSGNEDLENQNRLACIDSASQLAVTIQNSLLRRLQNSEHYKVFMAALLHIKHPDQKNLQLIDPMGGRFHQLVMDNNAAYNQIVSRSVIQLASMVAQQLLAGGLTGPDRGQVVMGILNEATVTTVIHEFVEWLNVGEGFSMRIQQCTRRMQDKLKMAEQNYEMVRSRFNFLEGLECPWQRSIFNNATDHMNNFNPLFDNAFIGNDKGFQPSADSHLDHMMNAYNVGDRPFNTFNRAPGGNVEHQCPELFAQAERSARYYAEQRRQRGMEEQRRLEDPTQRHFDMNDIDRVTPPFSEYTYEEAYRFRMSDYFKDTGKDGWLIGKWEDTIRLLTHTPSPMSPRTLYPNMMDFMPSTGNKVLVVKLNSDGHVIWKQIRVEDEMSNESQDRAWTNPDRVLPTMWEEQGELKTVFEARVETTKQRIVDGVPSRLGEMKALEEEPNMIAISEPVDLPTDKDIRNKINAGCKVFDPKNELDAFIAPIYLNTIIPLEGTRSKPLYSSLAPLTKGFPLTEYNNVFEMLRDVQSSLEGCPDDNLVDLIRKQITNVFNRYLVEQAGIPDAPQPNGQEWIKLDDIFDDAEDFIKIMQKRGEQTMLRYMSDIRNNDWMTTNLQFLMGEDEARQYFRNGVDENDVEAMAIAKVQFATNLIMSRDAVIVKLQKDAGPMHPGVIQSPESEDPRIHAIVKAAFEQGAKHFKTVPTIYLEYARPDNCPTRVVNFSMYDLSVMRTRAVDLGKGLLQTVAY